MVQIIFYILPCRKSQRKKGKISIDDDALRAGLLKASKKKDIALVNEPWLDLHILPSEFDGPSI
jgi:hypothetical protein